MKIKRATIKDVAKKAGVSIEVSLLSCLTRTEKRGMFIFRYIFMVRSDLYGSD